jgi:hypothetical protein
MALQIIDANNNTQNVLSPGIDPTYKATLTGWLAANLLNGKDFFQLQGSATKVVRVLKVVMSLTADGTNTGYSVLQMLRQTTADATNGTATVVTGQPCDANDPAATAVATSLTATVTNGTGTAVVAVGRLSVNGTTLLGTPLKDQVVWDFAADYAKAPILRGTSDFFGLRITNNAPTTSVADLEIYWSEGSI